MTACEPMPRYSLNFFPSFSTILPGDSSVPAKRLPSMTADAPAARALAISPDVRMPPSAMTGTLYLRATDTTSSTAESCGTPTPEMRRVVQMLPGPTPTFTAAANLHPAFSAFPRRDVAENHFGILETLFYFPSAFYHIQIMSVRAIYNDCIASRFVECLCSICGKRSARGGDFHSRLFHVFNYFHLHFYGAVAVDDTEASEFAEGYRHFLFRHAVHRGGDKRDRERYPCNDCFE